jgi:hypothetical protein
LIIELIKRIKILTKIQRKGGANRIDRVSKQTGKETVTQRIGKSTCKYM